MTNNPQPTTVNNIQDDPWAIDSQRIKEENEKKSAGTKVKWHNLPDGEGMSIWRIFPFRKRRSFFFKVIKHWNVPGFKGSVTCPRSFDDPDNPGKKLRCAICEKYFALLKSGDPVDQAIAKEALKQSTSYYVNAVNMEKPEDGVGVLNIPYAVYNTLLAWLDVPKYREFSHPQRGRCVIVKATPVPGSQIPNQPNKEKREYTVMPDDPAPIDNPEWLDQLYELDTVLGIPTFEFTQSCLEKILTKDPNAGALPEGTPLYRGQLAAAPASAPEQAAPQVPPQQFQPQVTVTSAANATQPVAPATVPVFAEAPVVTTTTTVAAPKSETEVLNKMKAILDKAKKAQAAQ